MKELTLEEIRIRGTAYKEGMREGRTQTLEKVKEMIKEYYYLQQKMGLDFSDEIYCLKKLLSKLEDDEVKGK